jgi:hypothetical protein
LLKVIGGGIDLQGHLPPSPKKELKSRAESVSTKAKATSSEDLSLEDFAMSWYEKI